MITDELRNLADDVNVALATLRGLDPRHDTIARNGVLDMLLWTKLPLLLKSVEEMRKDAAVADEHIERGNDETMKAYSQLRALRGQVVTLLGLCGELERFPPDAPLDPQVPVAEIRKIFDDFDRGNAPDARFDGHAPGCLGGHTFEISCAETAKVRADAAADIWACPCGRNCVHSFDGAGSDPGPDDTCIYGCGRTYGELQADLAARAAAEGSGTPEGSDHGRQG